MATFTLPLKQVIEYTDGNIGLDTYPIFDEAYREPLNQKIIDHFWNREIGQETIDIFVHAMKRKMNEIMPMYNQLYESQALALDPFVTFRTSSTSETTGTGTATSTGSSTVVSDSESESSSKAVNSSYPQTRIIDGEEYADTGADSTSASSGASTSQGDETGSQTSSQDATTTNTAEGFSGSMAGLLLEYRETFLNIDMSIIGELESLFMLLWDNGDAFSQQTYPLNYFGWF